MPDPFRELLATLPDEIALAREAGLPVVLEVADPLPLHAQRLMDTLGVEVRELTAVRDDTRERLPDGTLTAAEMDRRHQAALDAQPMRTGCAVAGCGWSYEGTTGECREQAFAHRRDVHGVTAAGKLSKKAERERGEAGAAQRRVIHARADERPAAAPAPRSWSRKAKTREEVIEAIQRFAREHGRTPSMSDFAANSGKYVSPSAANRLFGSWANAVEAAGFEKPRPVGRGAWTADAAVAKLQEVVAQLGRVPTSEETTDLGLPGVSAFRRLFGNWGDYVEAAGFARPTNGARRNAPAPPEPAAAAEPEPEERWTLVEPEVREAAAAPLTLDLITAGDTAGWIAKLDAEADRLRRRSEAFDTIADGLRQLQETER